MPVLELPVVGVQAEFLNLIKLIELNLYKSNLNFKSLNCPCPCPGCELDHFDGLMVVTVMMIWSVVGEQAEFLNLDVIRMIGLNI